MSKSLIAIALAVVFFAVWRAPVQGQRIPEASMVICAAPCPGSTFGLAAGNGFALMAANGEIWFYPLDQTPRRKPSVATPLKVGSVGSVGGPLEWAPNR
jgi:hypothetical protein